MLGNSSIQLAQTTQWLEGPVAIIQYWIAEHLDENGAVEIDDEVEGIAALSLELIDEVEYLRDVPLLFEGRQFHMYFVKDGGINVGNGRSLACLPEK